MSQKGFNKGPSIPKDAVPCLSHFILLFFFSPECEKGNHMERKQAMRSLHIDQASKNLVALIVGRRSPPTKYC